MEGENRTEASGILPVPRSKEEAKRSYDHISGVYDYFTGPFERKHAEIALKHLSIKEDVFEQVVDFAPS